ncbi:MAG TPA: dipeptide/oligopeptide/nickel ABC transporter ATP-binding protein, partial [Verrucomicrobiae bacterium]|nr:dipeptide/oligopeptide/nickel ABC transporter ATP-binding protein [Verrucomicrobiae bacterium]
MRQPFPSTTTPLLAVENLSVHFSLARGLSRGPSRVLKAVQDVSLSVQPGETLGVVGESGCGKTTLGRAILRLVPAAAGKILLEGEDITEMRGKQLRSRRRKIQMIFQDPYGSLNPRMTVEEIVSEAIKIQGGERPSRAGRIAGLLESVGLDAAHARRYPHQFSGGQRQRIGIARALAAQPRVIVCDEPVSALDVSIQAQIVSLIQDIQKEAGLSLLFISHDLSVVRRLSHRVMVLYLGRIVE